MLVIIGIAIYVIKSVCCAVHNNYKILSQKDLQTQDVPLLQNKVEYN